MSYFLFTFLPPSPPTRGSRPEKGKEYLLLSCLHTYGEELLPPLNLLTMIFYRRKREREYSVTLSVLLQHCSFSSYFLSSYVSSYFFSTSFSSTEFISLFSFPSVLWGIFFHLLFSISPGLFLQL